MRNAIKEYLSYSEDEKLDLWNHATFVFDTNVFLNLYRYTGRTREILLSAIDKLQARLWMPHQVAYEFMKSRNKIILETNNQYTMLKSDADSFIGKCLSTLKQDQKGKDLVELENQILTWIETAKKKNVIVTDSNSDLILSKLLSYYEGRVGPGFTEDELKIIETEGKSRYALKIPPGYKDAGKQNGENANNAYGDYIVWKQILNYAESQKKDIVLVTNDQKEDWWEIVHGQTIGPRPELRKEFFEKTSHRLHMYSMRSFITRFENGNDVEIDRETIDEIEFFSQVIHHKSNKRDLREYYQSFETDKEARAAKLRFEIMRLENKNRKRAKTIENLREKYYDGDMPDEIETMLDSTIANLEKDDIRIQKMQTELRKYRF